MDSFFRLLFHLWGESCFERIDEICLADEENEAFICDNRGLAWSVLAYALLAFLPLALGIVACAVVHVAGGAYLFGLPASGLLLTASLLLIVTQLIGLLLLTLLCTLHMPWEPRGAELALADILHMSPHGLQLIWRTLTCLPVAGLLLACLWR